MEKKKLKIKPYPTDFFVRSNCNASLYCDIALEAYYDALQLQLALEAREWYLSPGVDMKMPDRLWKKITTSIVFTAMTAEAFINNYLAVRLGDGVFADYNKPKYHYFDKLDIIMSDILKQENHQNLEWYKGIRSLFDNRNLLVHSVSKQVTATELVENDNKDDWRYTLQRTLRLKAAQAKFPNDPVAQLRYVMGHDEQDEIFENLTPKVADETESEYLTTMLEDARLGLASVSDMTRAIKRLDPNYDAFMEIFSPLTLLDDESDEATIRKAVFPKLGLNFTKADLERVLDARAKHAQSKK